jgi:protease-4
VRQRKGRANVALYSRECRALDNDACRGTERLVKVAIRRGVWLVLSLILLATVVSAMAVFVSYVAYARGTGIPAATTLVLRTTGDLGELEGAGLIGQFLPTQPTVRSVVDAIGRAKRDRRVKNLLVIPTPGSGFWAKTQEIRDAVLDFRKSGKKAVAFLEFGGEQEYALATACDKIFIVPTSVLDVKGAATYEVFLRGTLDKIGTFPDLLHIGDYKTAVNVFTEKTFTPAHREMTESLNSETLDQLVAMIAEGRRKSVDEVRALLDEGPFLPEEALDKGLVDDLAYRDQVAEKADLDEEETTEVEDYARATSLVRPWSRAPRVALIYAVGTIDSGVNDVGPEGMFAGSDTLVEYIEEARDDTSIRAIILRIDSPGGSSVASDVIWRALMLAKEKKPLVASMSDLAASGGYYIAIPADVIVAQPGTLTGSIGIFGGKFVTAETFKKLGANIESVSEGRFADIQSPIRRYSKEERAKVEAQLEAFYDQFIEKVALARKSTPEKIDGVAQGRVWTGRQARDLGLVDALGGLNRAIAAARERAKIPADQPVDLVVYPPHRSFLERVSDPFVRSGRAHALLQLLSPTERRAVRDLSAPVRLLRRREPLALMPYVFLR